MSSQTMPVQPVQKRVKNFSEVALGLTKKQAIEEATRCPQPTNVEHTHKCPLGVDIHGFIRLIREGSVSEAFEKIREHNPLSAVCGRICSAPCEHNVFEGEKWPVSIKSLERFAVEYGKKDSKKIKVPGKGQKIAIVGSGPAGLTAAAQLAGLGYSVTVFEAFHALGGVLRYGVPEFRLPRKILEDEINYIKSLGVSFKTDCLIGQTLDIKEIFEEGHKAVFLSVGGGTPKSLGIPGENLKRVFFAGEFLMRVNLMHAHFFPSYTTPLEIGKKIIVIGAGHDALDAARLCVRLGKETVLVHDRTEDEIEANRQDIVFAKEEGVRFEMFARPLEIVGENDGRVKAVKCVRMDFADPASSGKWKLMEVKGSEFAVAGDTVILCSGYKANALLGKLIPDLKTKKDGAVSTKANSFLTSIPGVFALQNALSLIEAMSQAKKAASEIDKYLLSQSSKK